MRTLRDGIVRRLRLFGASERGVQLIELAIALPVLLMLFAATAEFGRYFYHYSTLAKATRAGARYLATTPAKSTGVNTVEDPKVKNLVVYGDPNAGDGGTPIIPGLTPANVEIERVGVITTVPDTVTVRIINYNYTPMIDLGDFTKGKAWAAVPLKPSTTMRYLLTQPTP